MRPAKGSVLLCESFASAGFCVHPFLYPDLDVRQIGRKILTDHSARKDKKCVVKVLVLECLNAFE